MVALGGIGEAILGGVSSLAAAGGAVATALNPFDWFLIILILTGSASELLMEGGDINIAEFGAKNLAALALVALMKIDLPTPVNLLFFVGFWSITVPNIVITANAWGVTSYLTFFGVNLVSTVFFIPYFALFVMFIPMIFSWYRTVGL